jgi:D-3-phosphoglycerate dehydrogenase / 2-oxoglutarate reductase
VPECLIAVADGALSILDELTRKHAGAARFRVGDVSTPAALAETAAGADALIVTLHKLTPEHIAALPASVRVIGRAGVGLDTIDVDGAARRGVPVAFQPAYATNEVADHAVAMLLAAQRRLVDADRRLRAEGWLGGSDLGPVRALHESTAGVIGTGRIGRAAIDRLRPFVSRVIGYDVPGTPPYGDVPVGSDLPSVLAQSHLVTVHLPLTAETRHVIGAAELAALPAGAVLVNVSRGGLVDEAALAESLASGHLAAAALDVFEAEPLPADSPLRTAPNLLLSPHVAWYSSSSGVRLAEWTVEDVLAVLATGSPRHGRFAPVSAGAGAA